MGQRTPVDAASAWRPGNFPTDDQWSFNFTAALVEAVHTFANGGAIEELGRAFAAPLVRWRQILTDGPGFLRLRGFPTEGLAPEEIEHAYIGLGSLLGRPTGQDRRRSLITHIRDERRHPETGIRRFQTNLSQDFHSDAADIVGLLCLMPAKSGGESRIVSAHTVYNEMLQRDPHLLQTMYLPMPWSRHAEELKGDESHFELAPIVDLDGLPRISVIPWFIRQSQVHASAPRLSPRQLAALDLFEEITRNPEFHIVMHFMPGDLQLLNNTLVLHARDSFADYDEPSMRRHLLRIWISFEQPLASEVLLSGGSSRANPSAPLSGSSQSGGRGS
jgi:hypothetical protein